MVAPMTSYPASTSNPAATELSTPPDMATSTRSLTAPLPPIADWGFRIADWKHGLRIRNPQSPIRNCSPSPVQHRGQLPNLLNDLRQGADERLHVLRRAVPPQREPQRRHAELARDAHRREHMGGLDRPRAARRAR